MSKTTKRKTSAARRVTPQEQSRIDAKHALDRAVRRERDIQRLTKQLDRAVHVADGMLNRLIRNIAMSQGYELVAAEQQRAVGE